VLTPCSGAPRRLACGGILPGQSHIKKTVTANSSSLGLCLGLDFIPDHVLGCIVNFTTLH
jgi:hypothetical protein